MAQHTENQFQGFQTEALAPDVTAASVQRPFNSLAQFPYMCQQNLLYMPGVPQMNPAMTTLPNTQASLSFVNMQTLPFQKNHTSANASATGILQENTPVLQQHFNTDHNKKFNVSKDTHMYTAMPTVTNRNTANLYYTNSDVATSTASTNFISQYQRWNAYTQPLTASKPLSTSAQTLSSVSQTEGQRTTSDSTGTHQASTVVAQRPKAHLRKAAGTIWNDLSLDDWPENDYRVFCGDLGNEVTDELLSNAFRYLKSFQRAKVIRDKRTGKGKGFGFVSFLNPEDMLKAIKEMDRKYVGNRPIRVMRSKWKDREPDSEKNKRPLEITQTLNSKDFKKFKAMKPVTGGKKIHSSLAPPQNTVAKTFRGRGTYRRPMGSYPSAINNRG